MVRLLLLQRELGARHTRSWRAESLNMRVSFLILCLASLGGCASHHAAAPVARAAAPAIPTAPDTSIEVRHLYVFAPGKRPLLIVEREEASASRQEISSEPPTH